jgi:transposase
MDQVHVIRHRVRAQGVPIRRVAREMGVSRNTVRRYLMDDAPVGERQSSPRPHPVRDRVVARLDALLADSTRWTAGKQRLTAARVHDLLRGEGFEVGATTIKGLVREWRRKRQEVFVPLIYRPGELAEVDFFEVVVDVAGERRKAFLFVMRLMFSGRDFTWIYDRQDQVSFLDGHVRAFAHLGFVPRRIVYDNLRPAVRRLLRGSARELTERFEALVTHYVYEPCFARPRTGHDKGGVEARGKAIRWQELVPIPVGADLDSIAAALLQRLDHKFASSERAVQFDTEREHALVLPSVSFDARATCLVGVARRSLVQIAGASYSVPTAWVGLTVTARVTPSLVEIVGQDGVVISHPRLRFGQRSVDYRHYLPELAKKPQALRQVAPELMRDLGEPYPAAWQQLVESRGPIEAARTFAKILESVIAMGAQQVAERLRGALHRGEPVLLALRPTPVKDVSVARDALPESLRDIEVASPSMAAFDDVLGGVA